jgi:hypothetical protein
LRKRAFLNLSTATISPSGIGALRTDLRRKRPRQVAKAVATKVGTATDQFALSILDIGDCAQAVVFDLKEPIGVVERIGLPHDLHRFDFGKWSDRLALACQTAPVPRFGRRDRNARPAPWTPLW